MILTRAFLEMIWIMFGKDKSKNVQFLLPDGREVANQEEFNAMRMEQVITREMYFKSDWSDRVLCKSDIADFLDKSSKIYFLDPQDTIIAWGPVTLWGFPREYNTWQADAVLTSRSLVVMYQSQLFRPDIFIVEYPENITVMKQSPLKTGYLFSYGVHFTKGKKKVIRPIDFAVSERFGKDGHANRRSLWVLDSLNHILGN